MEARGVVESAHRVRQVCGQVFCFAVVTGIVERDITADLKGALSTPKKTNYAAIILQKGAALGLPLLHLPFMFLAHIAPLPETTPDAALDGAIHIVLNGASLQMWPLTVKPS
jgi:hypothetical protein